MLVAVIITEGLREAGEAFKNALVEAVVLDSLFLFSVYINTLLDGHFD